MGRQQGGMRDSERYDAQADAVFRMAARADSPAEKQVYLSIADGWRKLAAEAARNERQVSRPKEARSFDPPKDDLGGDD
jgi:hypothetical protein